MNLLSKESEQITGDQYETRHLTKLDAYSFWFLFFKLSKFLYLAAHRIFPTACWDELRNEIFWLRLENVKREVDIVSLKRQLAWTEKRFLRLKGEMKLTLDSWRI